MLPWLASVSARLGEVPGTHGLVGARLAPQAEPEELEVALAEVAAIPTSSRSGNARAARQD